MWTSRHRLYCTESILLLCCLLKVSTHRLAPIDTASVHIVKGFSQHIHSSLYLASVRPWTEGEVEHKFDVRTFGRKPKNKPRNFNGGRTASYGHVTSCATAMCRARRGMRGPQLGVLFVRICLNPFTTQSRFGDRFTPIPSTMSPQTGVRS